MSKFTLFGQEVEFSKASDRYYKMLKLYETMIDSATTAFKCFYDDRGNISDVLDDYMKFIYDFSENTIIEPLYNSLINIGIYDISREEFEDSCWDLSGAKEYYNCVADQYNEIVEELEEERNYRALRKASRNKFVGGGFGVQGAIKGAFTAGVLNAVTGAGHGIVNSLGNLKSSISASIDEDDLYESEETLEILDMGVKECIKDILVLFMSFINEYKQNEGEDIWYDGSGYNHEKASTLLENSSKVEGKEKELLFRAFTICPYHYNVLSAIFLNYEEERKNIFEIAKYYKIDLSPLFNIIIMMMYDEETQQSDEKAFEAKKKIEEFMSDYDIAENDTLDQLEQDCLVRYCMAYLRLLPEETSDFIEGFKKYDASDKNKAVAVERFNIWELFEAYKIDCSDIVKEEIIDNFIKLAKEHSNIGFDAVVNKAHIIMEALHVSQSDALDLYEYETLSEIAKDYETIPVGKANEIIKNIEECTVSQRIKDKYVYLNDIWELFPKYNIGLTQEEKILLLYRCSEKIDLHTKTTFDKKKVFLIPVIEAILATENTERIFNERKADRFLYSEIAQDAKALFQKANIYGDKKETYTHIGFLGNTVYEIENRVWLYGDTGFDNLLSELTNDMPDDEDEVDANAIFLIFAECIDNKVRYTFMTHDRVYSMKEGGSVYYLTVDEFKEVNRYGLLSIKDDNGSINVFSAEDRSYAECDAIAGAINDTIKLLIQLLGKKRKKLNQLKLYYNYIKKINNGETAEEPEFARAPQKKETTLDVQTSEPSNNNHDANQLNAEEDKLLTDVNNNTDSSSEQKTGGLISQKVKTSKEIVINLLKQDITSQNEHLRYLLPTSSSFNKKVEKAKKSYASISNDEIPLILYDASLLGNAKQGFLITDKYIYINNLDCNAKINVNDVINVSVIAKDSSFYYVTIDTANNRYNLIMLLGKDYAHKNTDLIANLIRYIVVSEIVKDFANLTCWQCQCGNTNSGKFCSKCGKPKIN